MSSNPATSFLRQHIYLNHSLRLIYTANICCKNAFETARKNNSFSAEEGSEGEYSHSRYVARAKYDSVTVTANV